MIVNVFEQELFGTIHWRVMRADGGRIFENRIMTDFPSEEDATQAIQSDCRRTGVSDYSIVVKRLKYAH